MGIFDSYSFWIVQGLCLITAVIMVLRGQKSDRRDFDLYHTYMCIPAALAFSIQGAWVLVCLCVVGATRTYLLTTDWGWGRRNAVVGICLCVAMISGAYNAQTAFDWFLLVTTFWCVGSEAFKNFLNLRAATILNSTSWAISSFLCGAYVNVLANIFGVVSNVMATERDFMLSKRFKAAVFNCEHSRAAYLARAV